MRGDKSIETVLVYVGSNPDDAIGENILKLPFLHALEQSFPAARITWISGFGPSQFEGVLTSVVDGRIDEILTDFRIAGSARELFFRWRPLRGRRFDLIIDTQRNVVRTLVLRRISHRVFISGCWRFFFSDRKPPNEFLHPSLLTEKLLGLVAAAVGDVIRPPPVWPLNERWRNAARHLLPHGPTYVALAPGAGNQETGKCWPLSCFLALAREQHEKGRHPVFFLGPGEIGWSEQIRREAPYALIAKDDSDVSGRKEPALAMALARQVDVAVANCSGIGHILAAGGPPMVSLYGPTRPSKYAPYASSVIVLRAQDFGTTADIDNIPLDAVSAAIDKQLRSAERTPN